jgi:hypothetical protein
VAPAVVLRNWRRESSEWESGAFIK